MSNRTGGDHFLLPPNKRDVVLGRGGRNNNRRRGTLYECLKEKYAEEYRGLHHSEKRVFVLKNIITPVRQAGGRFMYKHEKSLLWGEKDDNDIVCIIMQAVRDYNQKGAQDPHSKPRDRARETPSEDYCVAPNSSSSPATLASTNSETVVGESASPPPGPLADVGNEATSPWLDRQTSLFSQFTRTAADISSTLDPPPLRTAESAFSAISGVSHEPLLHHDLSVEKIGQKERNGHHGTLQSTDAAANHLVSEPRLHQLEGIVETLENENLELSSRLMNLEDKYSFRNSAEV